MLPFADGLLAHASSVHVVMIIRQSGSRLGRSFPKLVTSKISRRPIATEPVTIESPLDQIKTLETTEDTTQALQGGTNAAREKWRSMKQWEQLQKHEIKEERMGASTIVPYKPNDLIVDPPWPTEITLELLMASQAHMGHSTSLWNPRNSQYIYGIRQGIHIISLEATAAYLRRACTVVEAVAAKGGLLLFVGTRSGQQSAVVRAARFSKGCHLFERWVPGSLTNGQQILGHCAVQVVNGHDEPLEGYEAALVDRAVLKPDLVICLNPLENEVLLHECGLHNIPTIGIIDTDANPTWVTYPIPANDDSLRCIQVIAGALGRAGQSGQMKRLKLAEEKGKLPYPPLRLGSAAKSNAMPSIERSNTSSSSQKAPQPH